MSRPAVSEPAPGAGAPRTGSPGTGSPSSLPDVNAEINPYPVVQHLLDQTADFNLFAVPEPGSAERGTLTPGDPRDWFGLNGGYGLAWECRLHRFRAFVEPPAPGRLAVTQAVGERGGSLRCRCLFGKDDLEWAPGSEPPLAIYDPWASQRFTVEADFSFGEGEDFHGYGLGRTYPTTVEGRPKLLAGVVGNLMTGQGKFQGLEASFVMAGSITDLGFRGNVTCRVVDPEGRFRSGREIPALGAIADPALEETFFQFRGVKKDRHVKTTYGPPPDSRRVSLITPSQMRSADFRFSTRGHDAPRTDRVVGPVVGPMEATVLFDLLAPPGTAERPVPFTTSEIYTFLDREGGTVATLNAGIAEGISFKLDFPAAPGQPGVRFAGFGPITGGTGPLADVQGLLTVNSLIGISPHALSLIHVLYVPDPQGRFRRGG